MAQKILFALTNHRQLGTSGKTTGFNLLQLTHPYYELERAHHEIVFTSPIGGACFLDENTRDIADPLNRDYLGRVSFVERIGNTMRPQDLVGEEFAAILFVGGYGCLWDFPDASELHRLAQEIYNGGGTIGALGHGASALLKLKTPSREDFLTKRKITCESRAEEEAVGLTDVLPFCLENELKRKGAQTQIASLWQRHCIVDDRLITGQNLASARAVGEALVKNLRR